MMKPAGPPLRSLGVPSFCVRLLDEEGQEMTGDADHRRARRERYDLYRAKMYGKRPTTTARLRELERAHLAADARLEPAAHARPEALPEPGLHPDGDASPGRQRDGRPHQLYPLVERELAADQPCEPAGDGRVDAGLRQRSRQERHRLQRLDGLADPLGDLRGRDALGEQLAGAPVSR